jgi:sarcosine oxidase subunit alpha
VKWAQRLPDRFHPVPLSHLAGRGFTLNDKHHCIAVTLHWALSLCWRGWRRPEYYAQPGKSREECIRFEAEAVRTRVGIIDVGTLGKLELRVPMLPNFWSGYTLDATPI